jgi:hypothetical protein
MHACTHTVIGKTWLVTLGEGGGANKPWILGNVIYEGVHLERCGNILTLQNKINRIMVVAKPRTSCRSTFKKSELLPVPCQYVFSFVTLIVNNQENIQAYSSLHSINTRTGHHLRRPVVSLSCFQKGAFRTGVKIFSILPHSFVSLRNGKAQLKVVLRRSQYINTHFFYSVDELVIFEDDP